jgi:hypothetical protein
MPTADDVLKPTEPGDVVELVPTPVPGAGELSLPEPERIGDVYAELPTAGVLLVVPWLAEVLSTVETEPEGNDSESVLVEALEEAVLDASTEEDPELMLRRVPEEYSEDKLEEGLPEVEP